MRFKSSAVVKIHKLGNVSCSTKFVEYLLMDTLQLVSQFKDVRLKASCVLKEMSAALIKIGEAGGSLEHRRAFVQACTAVTIEQVHPSILFRVTFWFLTTPPYGTSDHP
jgi:N-terminal acetyltransferase B complex non-catalytic subunit